ncbi:hypothetical protein ESZ50_08030 [Weissella muntiaci]|uniref:Uncharacterized protein n=1 Tax=Weissella muntiaci TaxID=2508881 RepID=A0A6C2C4T5_9LACO|nr:hypothetical protein [Weissella muntiaci]TYC48817.1 hypothetical protein ESZ50_08030 [Weissella muntiaci]
MNENLQQNQPTPTVTIPFEVSYLAVRIGSVEMRFINTEENLLKLQNMSENPEEYVNNRASDLLPKFDELQAKVANNKGDAKWEDLAEVLRLQKEALTRIMDDIFIPGDFVKLYEHYPDLRQILALMPTMMQIIGQAVGISMENKEQEFQRKIAKLQNRKNKKRRNNRNSR